MKNSLILLVALLTLGACQKKQFFTSSPEIDLVKKADAAYFSGDWATLRSLYADTAKIIENRWGVANTSIDQWIENLKAGVANFSEYRQGTEPIYEMIVNDNGEKYTHSWQEWIGKHKSGKEVRTVVNISTQIVGDKIVWAGLVFDTHPFVEAESDSTAVMN